MRFKKLELLGFKSFADATEIVFEPGVTAIVGPNGVGKSNVADAIKWVLGEQSARELRGGRMEDVIFNGSDRRDPIHYAEVSLTLDNADRHFPIDYTEISISRRLFRSGESEYLLNKTPVRLKDITGLLMGSGIGTSSYSLFEQGRIEQIINARPEDRRVIFEEAAGITKFKSQKKEALRRLDETEENLIRLSDVIGEVRHQIQALERQVRRAKAYRENHDQLKRLEVAVARHEEDRLKGQWQAQEEVLLRGRGQLNELEQSLALQEVSLDEFRQKVEQAEGALTAARETLLKITHRQETAQTALEVNRQRIAEAKAREAQVHQELEAARSQVAQMEEQRVQLISRMAQENAERESKKRRVLLCQEQVEAAARTIHQAQETVIQAKERLLAATGDEVQVKNALAKLHQEFNRLEARDNRLKLEENKVAAERSVGVIQVEALRASLAKVQTRVQTLEEERRRHQESLAEMTASLETNEKRVFDLEQEAMRLGSQLELLKNLMSSHEGYSSGVKTLLTALDEGRLSKDGIHGVLAELMQVPPADSAAVDAALGPWSQAIVVDSSQTAIACRALLEESKAGRVLFLIRDRVPEGTAREGREGKEGAVGLIDRIGAAPSLIPLVELLTADTWLVPDRETALALLPNCRSTRFVTPAGEMFIVGGALLGPAPAQERLVVGRMNRLQSLETAFAQTKAQLEEAKEGLASTVGKQQAQTQALSTLEEIFQEKWSELRKVENSVELAEVSLSKLDQEQELLGTEKKEVEAQLSELSAQVRQWETELKAKDETLQALEAVIQRSQEEMYQAARLREENSVTLATAKTELASFDEIAASRRTSLQMLEETLKSTQAQVTSRVSDLERLGLTQNQWQAARQELELSLKSLAEERIQSQAQVEKARQEKEQVAQAARDEERRWQALDRKREELQSQFHAHEMELAQLNFQREQIAHRLSDVYQVSLEEPPADPAEVSSEEELGRFRQEIDELSQKLQKMGPVNLGSIEEERELQERYEHLTTQQNDLTQAKTDLHEAITQINRTTRAMFRETFEAIQKEFQATFKQLFQGGEARLILMDEEDLLESGIEIIARPPGKPLQAITLLSGGEKALTSIALLFAIFRVKPSPFCLLDEIDAPLDEANIDRFTNALKEFLKESQFIIVTHNKKTMTMADVLYGITMQESGVSRIVSVKFRQDSNGNGNGQSHSAVSASSDPTQEELKPTPAAPE